MIDYVSIAKGIENGNFLIQMKKESNLCELSQDEMKETVSHENTEVNSSFPKESQLNHLNDYKSFKCVFIRTSFFSIDCFLDVMIIEISF